MYLPFCGVLKLFVMATFIFVWGATLKCPVHSCFVCPYELGEKKRLKNPASDTSYTLLYTTKSRCQVKIRFVKSSLHHCIRRILMFHNNSKKLCSQSQSRGKINATRS